MRVESFLFINKWKKTEVILKRFQLVSNLVIHKTVCLNKETKNDC